MWCVSRTDTPHALQRNLDLFAELSLHLITVSPVCLKSSSLCGEVKFSFFYSQHRKYSNQSRFVAHYWPVLDLCSSVKATRPVYGAISQNLQSLFPFL